MGKHISERPIHGTRLGVCVVICLKGNKQSFSGIGGHLQITEGVTDVTQFERLSTVWVQLKKRHVHDRVYV